VVFHRPSVFDVKKLQPLMSIGLGQSNNSLAATVDGILFGNLGFWTFADKSTFAGGIKFTVTK